MSADPKQLNSTTAGPALAEHDALPPGTRFGEFEIIRVLGVGGFGIVYLAHDHSLERRVALKEYMPASLAARGVGPLITVRSGSYAETYAIGLRSFVNEARLLARFDHASLVKVYRFWEDNATAYMVMPFLQGITLRDARRAMAHAPDEAWIRSVIDPVMDALELLHRQGVYHRDIAPDNIMLPSEGPPILLDFGAARRVISDRTQSLTAILKPSYAPIEQYAEMTSLRQGPWTDIYALGAVLHYLLLGTPPEPATARAVSADIDQIARRQVAGVSQRMMSTVAWMLGVRPADRPQDISTVRAALNGEIMVPVGHAGGANASHYGSGDLAEDAATHISAGTTHDVDFGLPDLESDPDATLIGPVTGLGGFGAAGRVRRAASVHGDAGAVAAGRGSEQPHAQALVEAPDASNASGASARSNVAAGRTDPPRSSKSALFVSGIALAAVIAGVVLWQFVGLLGAQRDAGRALTQAASAPASAVLATGGASNSTSAATTPSTTPSTTLSTTSSPISSPDLSAMPTTTSSPPPAASTVDLAASVPSTLATARSLDSTNAASRTASGAASSALMPRGAFNGASGAASGATRTARAQRNPRTDGAAQAPTGDASQTAGSESRPSVPLATESSQVARAPLAPVAAGPTTAREACGSRVFISLAICMERECERPGFRAGADCVKVLEVKHAREERNR